MVQVVNNSSADQRHIIIIVDCLRQSIEAASRNVDGTAPNPTSQLGGVTSIYGHSGRALVEYRDRYLALSSTRESRSYWSDVPGDRFAIVVHHMK